MNSSDSHLILVHLTRECLCSETKKEKKKKRGKSVLGKMARTYSTVKPLTKGTCSITL